MTAPGQARSMTGFGTSQVHDDHGRQSWEIRTVNSRYLEVKWRIPGYCRRLEGTWERIVREHLARGRVEISLDLRLNRPDSVCPTLDMAQAQGMLDQMHALADRTGLAFEPDLNQLLHHGGLWREPSGDLPEPLVGSLVAGLRTALRDVQETRSREGRTLSVDILERLDHLTRISATIRDKVSLLAPKRMETLRERVDALLQGCNQHKNSAPLVLDEPRLLQEFAQLADRLDVSEELTRLSAHLEEAVRILTTLPDPGRRLDFLFQECLREITTCGNKTQDADISRDVVAFKAELEKSREQVQNLE
ncbi:YicC/YloC family endoribonuclease [Desulfonatronum sp. SC1]|uniref:YicC/YloC family endoribonuclease n=1 Tax=Desulfonatronum sp. SC1 TaxID=2109626 RepID=UPI000D304F48|nr:YicC/YloC family endoribonuclease [Desulfonatronum sp. SC1]PTN36086.1 YicC family protein [Desulfonatronum sp. SC1]